MYRKNIIKTINTSSYFESLTGAWFESPLCRIFETLHRFVTSGEGFERCYFSKGWVFPGWIGFSQWFKKEVGVYAPREMLVGLGKMSKEERDEHTWFGLYLWEKKHRKGRN